MTKPIGRDTIYRCRRFSAETIELCVRWYTTARCARQAEPVYGRSPISLAIFTQRDDV